MVGFGPAATAHAAWRGLNGRISLTQRPIARRPPPANRDVYAAARDATMTQLTSGRANDEQSSWSPDGLGIAFPHSFDQVVVECDGRRGRGVAFAGRWLGPA